MIVFPLCLLLLAATSEAARIAPALFPNGLMIDGKRVEIEEVPYLAIIQYAGRPICAGAIISREQILTSARCFGNYGVRPENYKVRIGSSSRNTTDGRHLQIQNVRRHESFAGTYQSMSSNGHQVPVNDLAMIVTEPMDFDAKSKPIPLFDDAERVQPGINALVTGWLRSNGSELLTTKVVSILHTEVCDMDYYRGDVRAGQICAYYPGPSGKDACLGDSGGPLVVDGRLAGILSWGNGCAKSHGPGLYTAIGYYRDWIDNGGRDIYSLPWEENQARTITLKY